MNKAITVTAVIMTSWVYAANESVPTLEHLCINRIRQLLSSTSASQLHMQYQHLSPAQKAILINTVFAQPSPGLTRSTLLSAAHTYWCTAQYSSLQQQSNRQYTCYTLINARQQEPCAQWLIPEHNTQAAFSPAGKHFAISTEHGISIINMRSDSPILRYRTERTIINPIFYDNSTLLFFTHTSKKNTVALHTYNIRTDHETVRTLSHKQIPLITSSSYKGILCMTHPFTTHASTCFAIDLLGMPTLNHIARITKHTHPIQALTVSHDGGTLASADTHGIVLRWNIANQPFVQLPTLTHPAPLHTLACSPDGTYTVSLTHQARVFIWNKDILHHTFNFAVLTGVIRDPFVTWAADNSSLALYSGNQLYLVPCILLTGNSNFHASAH